MSNWTAAGRCQDINATIVPLAMVVFAVGHRLYSIWVGRLTVFCLGSLHNRFGYVRAAPWRRGFRGSFSIILQNPLLYMCTVFSYRVLSSSSGRQPWKMT